MAKKKSKARRVHREAEPKKAPKKKKPSSAGWVVGVIIVIVIIIAIILLLRSCAKEEVEQPPVVTPPTEAPQVAPTPEGPEIVSEVPKIVRYCSENYAIGWPEFQIDDPCTVEGNEVTVSLMYSGKGDSLAGMWFEATTTDGKMTYLKDSRAVSKGDIMEYKIPDIGGKIDTMLALPMIKEDGEDKYCLNQRLYVVKATNCVIG